VGAAAGAGEPVSGPDVPDVGAVGAVVVEGADHARRGRMVSVKRRDLRHSVAISFSTRQADGANADFASKPFAAANCQSAGRAAGRDGLTLEDGELSGRAMPTLGATGGS
jgi:hypothetical protein